MTEGFDIGLEMSGSADALRAMIANMAHGGRIAVLGIPTAEITLDLNQIIFNMLTVKGIYGREMYETWYQMTVMLQSGLDITPVITPQEVAAVVPAWADRAKSPRFSLELEARRARPGKWGDSGSAKRRFRIKL